MLEDEVHPADQEQQNLTNGIKYKGLIKQKDTILRNLSGEDNEARNNGDFIPQRYRDAFKKSLKERNEFWSEVAKTVTWTKPWKQIIDNIDEPFTKWFVGGELNACYNAVDRHVESGIGERVALIHDSPVTNSITKITYSQLQKQVSLLAGYLADLGVKKGDRVLIYMPLIPETIMAMLATVRLGAIHSVVFGGFAARELCVRINHAEPKVIIAASCGVEPNKVVRYKDILNEALASASIRPRKCIIFQRQNVYNCRLTQGLDVDWEEALQHATPHPCVPVESNHPLYLLYTSGTTGQPKGVVRPTGGHIATLAWTMKTIYGVEDGDIWWTASDMGWVVGHSYICYGPLTAGVTSVMYEGKPDRTPNPGSYFRVIQDHKVNAVLTAPTALRVIRRADPDLSLGKKYKISTLRQIFVAGEHCDNETKVWAEKTFKIPILNHWWQTETGHAITASCLGYGHCLDPPRQSAGLPFPGYDVRIIQSDGTECSPGELGRIVVKLPLPPGTLSTLYKSTHLFLDTYFRKFPGYYDTMDAGYKDENGYIYVTARDDDVINVAGHRLSTAAIEDVVLSHPDVADAAVIGAPEPTKGEIPVCFYVPKPNAQKSSEEISKELIRSSRELIGPIAALKYCLKVSALPRTRSGKTARKSIADLARSKLERISGTIEDPTVYDEIKMALQSVGYATANPTIQH